MKIKTKISNKITVDKIIKLSNQFNINIIININDYNNIMEFYI